MTLQTFEIEKYMPDWTVDFDTGAFLDSPPDDVNQGSEHG